jgi:hypothetical protein
MLPFPRRVQVMADGPDRKRWKMFGNTNWPDEHGISRLNDCTAELTTSLRGGLEYDCNVTYLQRVEISPDALTG